MNKLLLAALTASVISGCGNDAAKNAVHSSGLEPVVAAAKELQWSESSQSNMTWAEAYRYCDSLPAKRGRSWRLPSPKEFIAKYKLQQWSPPGDGEWWSALWHESGRHFTVNYANGAKSWSGDDRKRGVQCVAGYSAAIDPEAWIMEVYNSRQMKNSARAVETIRFIAEAGDAGGQLEMGNLFLDGTEVQQDIDEAKKWYRKASQQGEPNATDNLRQLDAGLLPPPANSAEQSNAR